jgi:lipopolysaccharide transport system permease protein
MPQTESDSSAISWDRIISPRKSWFNILVGALWNARELIQIFVWRDFVATYKQTALGTLWYLIQPLIISLTYMVIFGFMIGLSTDNLPPLLFYLSGTVIWHYFSSNFAKIANTFIANAQLLRKVYFPRLVVPLSIVLSNLISFGIQFGVFLFFLLVFQLRGFTVHPNSAILLLPLFLLIMGGLGLGCGLIITAITTRYRDFQYLVNFGTQLLLFATPVIYPISAVPERFRWLIWMNPISSIVESFRFAFLGSGSLQWAQLLYSFLFMLAVLLIGLFLFHRVEDTFVDTI